MFLFIFLDISSSFLPRISWAISPNLETTVGQPDLSKITLKNIDSYIDFHTPAEEGKSHYLPLVFPKRVYVEKINRIRYNTRYARY